MRLANDPKPEETKAQEAVADTEAREPVEEIEGFSEQNARDLSALIKDFLSSYAKKPPEVSTRQWLHDKLKQELPDKSEEEISSTVDEIISDIEAYDKSLASLNKACASGTTKEEWLADTLKEASVAVSVNQFGEYLSGIDQALAEGNAAMRELIMTQEGVVSQNPNLDGFIAEQHHVNTFNADAALKNLKYRAERLDRPEGGTFGKNSVDIRIFDKNTGETVHRYQAKFYKTAEKSIRAVNPSRYGNQQGLVPKGHAKDNLVNENLPKRSKKTITDTIGGTDKVDAKSTPLSKKDAKRYQENTQRSGRVPDKMTWNRYTINELTRNIGREAAMAGVHAAALTAGMDMAFKVMQGEKIEGEKVIETAITTGADAGVKAATAGALKVGVEKGLVPVLSKKAPFVMIACVAVENIKVMAKFAKGELTATETLDYLGRNTVSVIGSLAAAGKGAAIGAAIGALGGPIGALIGGFVGGVIGGIAGSAVGKAVYEGGKAIAKTAVSVAKTVGGAVCSAGRAVASGIASAARSIGSFLGF